MAGEGPTFRTATTDDAAPLVALKRDAIHEIAGWEYSAEQVAAWAPDESAHDDFAAALAHDAFVVIVAEARDGLVGYGVLATDRASIDAVYVHPDHTGEGIATSLVRQLETRARMCGLDELTIVSSHNASRFYESLGYWHVDETERDIDGVTVTFDVMRKYLDSNWPT